MPYPLSISIDTIGDDAIRSGERQEIGENSGEITDIDGELRMLSN